MPIEPKEMVDYAYQLHRGDDGDEMRHRNVINRAYYGAFLTARDMAKITRVSGSVHKDVSDHYENTIPLVQNNLDELKRLRQKADYKPMANVTYRDATNSLRKAKTILDNLAL